MGLYNNSFVFFLLILVKRNNEVQSYTLDIQFKGNRIVICIAQSETQVY